MLELTATQEPLTALPELFAQHLGAVEAKGGITGDIPTLGGGGLSSSEREAARCKVMCERGHFASIFALFNESFYSTTNIQLALCSQKCFFSEIREIPNLMQVSLCLAADSSPS